MDSTWVFIRREERLELQRRETDEGVFLTVSGPAGPRSYRFPDISALVRFQCDMEQFLLETGWSFTEFTPERRVGRDRRTFPRLDERRRWWTDSLPRPAGRHARVTPTDAVRERR